MVDFASLKRNSGKAGLDRLAGELDKLQSGSNRKTDDRFWYPTRGKDGNGWAIFRFLPTGDVEEGSDPFIRMFKHAFQGPGGWYIENSLTTIGKDDPVGEHNSTLWNTGDEKNKEIVRKQKRKMSFISNVLVIKDPAKPEVDGQVKLFEFGKKIMDKLTEAMTPPEDMPEMVPLNPWDLWTGAPFTIRVRKGDGGWPNYDKSSFGEIGPLAPDDQLEKLVKRLFPLKPFHDETNFKSYDDLKKRLDKVLAAKPGSQATAAGSQRSEAPSQRERPAPTSDTVAETTSAETEAGGDDPDLDYFRKLAK